MFVLIFNQLIKMLFIMMLGYVCYKIKLVNQEGNRTVSNLLLMVINPCLIITVYQRDFDAALARGLLITCAAAIGAHIIAIFIARILIPEKNNPDYSLERFAAIYSNCGFIGIPLINSVLGAEGVFYLTAYMTVFNIFTWTHGLCLIERKFSWKQLREGLLSPMVVATVIAICLFFIQLRIPTPLLDAMDYVADMNTPIAMLIAGFSVAQADLLSIFKKFRIYWVAVIKLIIVPLAVMLFVFALGLDYDIAYVTMIAAACPTATTTTMMAIRYNKNYTYSSEMFAFSTVLSMVTIPLVTFIAGFLLG